MRSNNVSVLHLLSTLNLRFCLLYVCSAYSLFSVTQAIHNSIATTTLGIGLARYSAFYMLMAFPTSTTYDAIKIDRLLTSADDSNRTFILSFFYIRYICKTITCTSVQITLFYLQLIRAKRLAECITLKPNIYSFDLFPFSIYSCFDKGCPTISAQMRLRQC